MFKVDIREDEQVYNGGRECSGAKFEGVSPPDESREQDFRTNRIRRDSALCYNQG